jgi:hypothetical protein
MNCRSTFGGNTIFKKTDVGIFTDLIMYVIYLTDNAILPTLRKDRKPLSTVYSVHD